MRVRALFLFFIVGGAACGNSVSKNDLAPTADLGVDDLSASDDMQVKGDLAMPSTTSGMIQAVRTAAEGTHTDGGVLAMALPVKDVLVTYLRPEVSGEIDDPPAFFVQADPTGPALLVRVNPATLSPPPQVGDLVAFTVTGAELDSGGVHVAASISGWTVKTSGNATAGLVQNLSAATDLVSKINTYESELSTVTGTISGTFSSAGAAYVQAAFATAGVADGPKLRIPTTLRDALELGAGCALTVSPTPMWRFSSSAQPSAWVSADITAITCPAPRVTGALAKDATHVIINFDRNLKAASLLSDGSQFVFTGGISIDNGGGMGALLTTPTQVTLTTSAQVPSTAYTVTAAATLTDTRDQGIDAAHNNASFGGYVAPAKLIINELNANIAASQDEVELRVVLGGSVAGFKLYQDYTSAKRIALSDLPANLVVATGDLIVVHLAVPAVQTAPGIVTEFNVGNVFAAPITQCANAVCTAGWDIVGTTASSLPMTRRVVSIVGADGVVQDAIAYSKQTGGSVGNGVELQAAIDAGFWTGPCAGGSCGDALTLSAAPFDSIALNVNAPALGTTAMTNSIQRKSTTQPSSAADWETKASTFGAAN